MKYNFSNWNKWKPDTLKSVLKKLDKKIDYTGILTNNIPKIRHDIQKLVDLEWELRSNYLDTYVKLHKKHDKLFNVINNLVDIWNKLWENNKELSNDEIKQLIYKYNMYVQEFDSIKNGFIAEQKRDNIKILLYNSNALEIDKESEKYKKELKNFSKDLWKELFPETNVEKFVKWANNQDKLEDYQKILIAPANWVEHIIEWVMDLFDVDSYKDLSKTLWIMEELDYEDWCNVFHSLKIIYKNIETADKISFIIWFIVSLSFIIWGSTRILQIAKKFNLSKWAMKVIKKSIITANSVMWAKWVWEYTLLWAITWISFDYI